MKYLFFGFVLSISNNVFAQTATGFDKQLGEHLAMHYESLQRNHDEWCQGEFKHSEFCQDLDDQVDKAKEDLLDNFEKRIQIMEGV